MKKNSILIVDDRPENRMMLSMLLKPFFSTHSAENGTQALSMAAELLPDLILLDIMMPDIDGFTVSKKLKEDPVLKEIPVIFISALADITDKVKGFEAGGVDYIPKPFQKEEILARVSLHLTLREQKKELQELNATKDKFFSIISHDLKNPFSSLLAYSAKLKKEHTELSEQERARYIDNLYTASHNTYELLENLLHWSRSQRGAVQTDFQMQPLKAMIDESLAPLNGAFEQKNISLEISGDEGAEAYFDHASMQSTLQNLLTNAAKFTNQGGTVTVDYGVADNAAFITISDNGVGMSEEHLDNLFKIDKHCSSPGTDGETGTGLGLLLCKEFVELNGGSISVFSRLDEGSEFRLQLPLRAEKEKTGPQNEETLSNGKVTAEAATEQKYRLQTTPAAKQSKMASDSQQNINIPDKEILAIMHKLSLMGDVRGLGQELDKLEQLGAEYAMFANLLRKYVDTYKLEKISDFIAGYLDRPN